MAAICLLVALYTALRCHRDDRLPEALENGKNARIRLQTATFSADTDTA
jgi:hypothetical protein